MFPFSFFLYISSFATKWQLFFQLCTGLINECKQALTNSTEETHKYTWASNISKSLMQVGFVIPSLILKHNKLNGYFDFLRSLRDGY